MVPLRVKRVLFSLATLLLVASGALLIEAILRSLYPEFTGETHSGYSASGPDSQSNITRGINAHRRVFREDRLVVRTPYRAYRTGRDDPLMIICGDSVTNGYGTAFEDIYWGQLQRMIDIMGGDSVEIVPLIYRVRDAPGTLPRLQSAFPGRPIKLYMYQFNFNDIRPSSQLESPLPPGATQALKWDWFNALAQFRFEYLNRSTSLRVAQHYYGVWRRKTSGTCEERGLDALGAYTWSYGSRPYAAASTEAWAYFAVKLAEFSSAMHRANIKPVMLVSPIAHDIDPSGLHPYIRQYNLDFSCATIDPRAELQQLAAQLDIDLIDPAPYLRDRFERRVAEGNFTPFFFPADENHFTPVAARYIAEYIFSRYQNLGI